MKVGDTIYLFNDCKREYGKDGKQIYRAHFESYTITSETARSWLTDSGYGGDPQKFDKKTLLSSKDYRGIKQKLLTADDVDNLCYLHDYRHVIVRAVQVLTDVALLRQIDALLPKKETKP